MSQRKLFGFAAVLAIILVDAGVKHGQVCRLSERRYSRNHVLDTDSEADSPAIGIIQDSGREWLSLAQQQHKSLAPSLTLGFA